MGYEPTPPGTFIDSNVVRGYFIDFRAKTIGPEADSPESLLPADLAQLALGWWDRHLAGDPIASGRYVQLCDVLLAQAEVRRDELWWPYPLGIAKYRTAAPTYSAMAQAQAASAFVRAYLLGADTSHGDAALAALNPILRSRDGLVARTPHGPVLEESPSNPPSHILNGWIYSLWGVLDVAMGLGDDRARTFYEGSLDALRKKLVEYDVGWWTRYSLYPHRLPDLAKPFYHRLHIDQMVVLHRLTSADEFGAAAARWRGYDSRLHRYTAVAQKAAFVATRYA